MCIIISQFKNYSISVDQSRHATSVVAKYLDSFTIKENSEFNKNTLPHDLIFTKAYNSASDEKLVLLLREYNIHFRACEVSFVYLLSNIVYFCFAVNKLAKFSSNPGKVHFEYLVHLLRYIRDNKNLGLIYYAKIEE